MHILQVAPYYAPAYAFGGVVRMVEGLSEALIRRGHRVTVLTTDAFNLKAAYDGALATLQNEVRVLRCPNVLYGLRRYNLSSPCGMRARARELVPDVDVVHLHEFRTTENLLVSSVAHEHEKALVLSPHGTLTRSTGRSRFKVWWDRLLSPAVAQRINHVVALTESELQDVQALWPQFAARKITTQFSVIPNGINPREFAHLPDDRALRAKYDLGNARIILFMGRLHRRKGVDVLVQAYVQANLPNSKLLLVGPDEGMQETLKSMGDRRVVMTGYLDGEARLAALSAADLFVLPAIGEGLSMAVLEAMGVGLPVLLSPGCNLPEAEAAGAGLVVQPDVDSLTAALQDLWANYDLAAMAQAAQQLIQQRFTWDQIVQQMEAVYQSTLKRKTA